MKTIASTIIACLTISGVGHGIAYASPQNSSTPAELSTAGIQVTFDPEGRLSGIGAVGKPLWPLAGETLLSGFNPSADLKKQTSPNGVAFTRVWHDESGRTAEVTDRFTREANALRWEVEISSQNPFWSTPVISRIQCVAPEKKRVWAPWGAPDCSGETRDDKKARQALLGQAMLAGGWSDPLVPVKFPNRVWSYGNNNGAPTRMDYLCMPLVSLLSPEDDSGISFVQSPADTLLSINVGMTQSGWFQFDRRNYRFGGGKAITFTMFLVPHEASWRGGLRFMTERYPEFFNPPNPRARQLSGCGAYSADESPIDAAKFRKMAFGFKWNMANDCPYFGMFLPPVKDADEKWQRINEKKEPPVPGKPNASMISCRQMDDHAKRLKDDGFFYLAYFDVNEFGQSMKGRKPVASKDDPDMWRDPAALLAYRFPNAGLPCGTKGTTQFSAYGTLVVDPGDPDYAAFMVEQVERHIRFLPHSDGFCVDRGDWLRFYNPKGDDGHSWVNGKPSRFGAVSWCTLMEKFRPLLDRADKVIFFNPHSMRLETLRHVDGIYNEFGQNASLNTAALMGLRKPVVQWTWQDTVNQPGPDAFMQRHLHMGCFPTAPYPYNNHCIKPTPEADRLYAEYGPLLDALRGKQWVLAPHCVETEAQARVNLFEIPGGYALPVTFAGKQAEAVVRVKNIPLLDSLKAEVIHPDANKPVPLEIRMKDGVLELTVPIVRGCAMVKLIKVPGSTSEPLRSAFSQ